MVCQMKLEDRKSQRLGNHNSQDQATRWSYLTSDIPTLEKCRQPSESNLRLGGGLMCTGLANFANLTHERERSVTWEICDMRPRHLWWGSWNLSMHLYHLEGRLKQVAGPTPQSFWSVSLRICMSMEFPGDADRVGLRSTLRNIAFSEWKFQ